MSKFQAKDWIDPNGDSHLRWKKDDDNDVFTRFLHNNVAIKGLLIDSSKAKDENLFPLNQRSQFFYLKIKDIKGHTFQLPNKLTLYTEKGDAINVEPNKYNITAPFFRDKVLADLTDWEKNIIQFQMIAIEDNEIKYLRWKRTDQKDIFYVNVGKLHTNTINQVSNKKVQGAYTWYVAQQDLNYQSKPKFLDLYSACKEYEKITLNLEKLSGYNKWYEDFLKIAQLSMNEAMPKDSNNPYGRYYNYPDIQYSFQPYNEVFLKNFQYLEKDINDKNQYSIYHGFSIKKIEKPTFIGLGYCGTINQQINSMQFENIKNNYEKIHQTYFNKNYEISSNYKTIFTTISGTTISIMDKKKRNPSQETLMNKNSANDIAEELGLDIENYKYEWLHLVAFSMGLSSDGSTVDTPQKIENLVLGTEAANTAMLMYETALKNIVLSRKKNIQIEVRANKCLELQTGIYTSWIAQEIIYEAKINNKTLLSITFNPFQAVDPCKAESIIVKEVLEAKIREIFKDDMDIEE